MSTFDVGLLNNSYTLTDSLNLANPDDAFSFQLSDTRSLKLSLLGLSTPVDWQLKDNIGTILDNGSVNPSSSEAINFSNLAAGDYSLQVSQTGDGTDYTLKIDPLIGLNLDSGFFTVGQTGQVGVDYLIDGGGYQGELAIFSLTGMEGFEPGSTAFIKETARRSLTNSTEGYITIKDATEGAKFSPTFPWGDNHNGGEYKNIQTFTMKPGEQFGFILVPNGTVQEVFDNPNIGDAKRPLFSLVTANPNEAFHVGQIADVIGDGKTFVMEDRRVDTGSDKDYNDLVFRVTGATGKAVNLDEVIDPGKDWRPTNIGEDLRDYINTPPQFLQFNTNSVYQPGEIVKLIDGKVFDENGDLDKVDLFWFKDGNEVKHDTINQFTVNEDWGTFNYSWTPTTPGNYQVKAIAYDKYGYDHPQKIHQSNEVIKNIRVNSPPENLKFSISKNLYNADEQISITAATVDDADGFADLSKVQFWLKKDNDEWIANTISSFSELSANSAGFTYNLPNLEAGSYQLKAVAYDKTNAASNEVLQSFSVLKKPDNPPPVINTPPEYLQFNLQDSYQYGESINLTDGKVYDANGWNDLKNVEIKLQKDGSNITNYYATNFQPGADNHWGIFNYSLNGLAPGNYYLEASASDGVNSSNLVSKYFTISSPPTVPINRGPESLEFSILPLYTNTEQISFSWGKVSDPDGASDIADVFFWLGTLDGKGSGVGDVKQFEIDSEGNARFDFSHDLNNLAPGRYQLWAIAQDKAGNYSTPATQNFAIITDPGEGGLADDERIAIADAGNLENYNPEALDRTKQWVVWLTPGQSSQELAAQIGAEDLGATEYIPNTYIWKFPDTVTTDDAINLLSPRPGVEFFYPLVPTELTPQFIPNDVLFPDQWHLQNTGQTGGSVGADINVTKAWDISVPNNPSKTVRGTGVVIGIVDDGIQYNHPDLAANYRWYLSRDFNETIGLDGKKYSYRENPSFFYDFEPAPTYKTIITKEFQQSIPIKDGRNENDDFLLVPLTGVTTDVNVSLNLTHSQVSDLDALLRSPDDPIFNPLVGSISGGNRRLPGGGDGSTPPPIELFTNIGGNGATFINTILELDDEGTKSIQNLTAANAPLADRFFPKGRLSNFDNLYANGNWNLRVSDEIWNRKSGQINSWNLELDTYNPHGTSVAGLAAASGNNSMGVTGVAPGAGIAGLRLIADEVNDKQIADALFYRSRNIDIYNNSWKEKDELNLSPSVAAMRLGTSLGRRNGLGNIYVFAGGNNRWSGGNVNYNGFANSRYVIPVAAIDHEGKHTWYSEQGAPLLVSAYSSSVNNADGKAVGLTTTDLLGNQGLDAADYTSRSSGTSSAAPLVSGTIALMLEANPNLSWRDVQHILVNTAKKTDPTDPDWKQNGAGLWVNHNYGFGVIDAEKAVLAATTWKPVVQEEMVTNSVKNVLEDIPDGDDQTGIISKINIDRDISVEKVEVLFNTKPSDLNEDWKYWGDLRVVLTSPDGTESILAEPHTLANNPDASSINERTKEFTWKFTSARHWGESSQGEWKLQVLDMEGNQIKGDWNSWKLNIYGTKPTVTVITDDPIGTEGGDPGRFMVTRTGNTKNQLTVNYTTTGSATNGADYNAITGSVTIAAGATSAPISITVIDDNVLEGNENVVVNLAASNAYILGNQNSATVDIIDNEIPTNRWTAKFINRTSANVSDRNYDFNNPAAILDLGDQHQGRTDGGLRLYQNWGDGSPTSGVQTDNFAMEAWTRTNFEAGKLYKITTQSDDGIWFRAKNAQTGEWTGNSVVLGYDGADWRDRSAAMPPRTIFFKVPESGEYDFYVQYYERAIGAVVDINIEEAQVFQDSVNESQQWKSTVYWSDRKLGNVPPVDFYTNQSNLIGVVSQGSNTRSDGKKGINFKDFEYEALNDDVRLPDNNYAIRSYTQTNLEAGVKYRAKVTADDGFQLLAKRANTNEWVYFTPKDQWQQAYGGTTVDFEVPQDGLYDMHFNYYEERGDAGLDLSWEVVPFTGRLLPTTTTNIRSGPGTNYSLVGTIPFNPNEPPVTVTFDKWTNGGFVDYTAELGTSSDIWYRIAGTNQWISAAIVSPKQYDTNLIVADSVQDFSFTQGQDNWYYGYYDGNLTSQDFKQFTVADPDPSFGWIFNGTNYYNSTYWTFVGPTDLHPSGLAPSNRTSEEQWVTRRWISEVGGTINLSGTLKKISTAGGNGIVGRIYVDGVQVWSQDIAYNDDIGVNYNFNTTVNPGSKVDFVLDPKDSEQFHDRSLFTSVVTKIG